MTDEKEKIYEEHKSQIFRSKSFDDYSADEIEEAFSRVLMYLPNDAKLYKYRKFEEKSFKYAYDSLEQGYLWLSQASEFNDDYDSTLNYNPEEEIIKIKNYLLGNPGLYLKHVYNNAYSGIKFGKTKMDHFYFGKVIDCVDYETGVIDEEKAVNLLETLGILRKTAKDYIKSIKQFIDDLITKNDELAKKIADNFLDFNKSTRNSTYVYSMSESYDINSMWAYYADSNKGFCIEYDYNKAKSFPIEEKKVLINTLKVNYNKWEKEFSFIKLLKYFLTGKKDDELYLAANKEIIEELLSKEENQWSHEREWRILLSNAENVFFADLVSAIYIDERCITDKNCKENCEKLIELCKTKKWKIILRKTNRTNTAHTYEKYCGQD